jgi:hypothetical protein
MLNRDFKEFAALLHAKGVEYLLIGGYALAAHGHPRYTGDIDFWINPSPANLRRLLDVLTEFGFGSLGLKEQDFSGDNVIQLGYPPGRIDLLTQIDGVHFSECWLRKLTFVTDSVSLNLIGREDFKTNKRAVGRLKDLADIEAIERLKP